MKRVGRIITLGIIAAMLAAGTLALSGCSGTIKIKALIIPHFEVGEMTGDSLGEAQIVYEKHLPDAKQYSLANGQTLYVNEKNGVALCVSGMGKTAMSSCLATTLSDKRFDFSSAYLIVGGCAGGNMDYVTFGDVCLSTAAVDYDFGHSIDSSEAGESSQTWFHDEGMASAAVKMANSKLMDSVYALIKDVKLDTVESVREGLQSALPENEVVKREPKVVRGTSMTSDNYWKGSFEHKLALLKTATYECPDPYAVAEMEDVAAMTVAEQFGMLNRTIVLRVVSNADTFLGGATPEMLWLDQTTTAGSADNIWLSGEIFDAAMGNLGKVELALVDAILSGKL